MEFYNPADLNHALLQLSQILMEIYQADQGGDKSENTDDVNDRKIEN